MKSGVYSVLEINKDANNCNTNQRNEKGLPQKTRNSVDHKCPQYQLIGNP